MASSSDHNCEPATLNISPTAILTSSHCWESLVAVSFPARVRATRLTRASSLHFSVVTSPAFIMLRTTWLTAGCDWPMSSAIRSEEHTSELQSRPHLVCRLLLEKKNK